MAQLAPNPVLIPEAEPTAPKSLKKARWFFACMAAVLIVAVAVGFAPSFYLRGVNRPQQAAPLHPLPAYLILHGIVLTLWFALFFVQSCLISTRRVSVHRTLGVAGAVLAGILVPLSLFVVTRSVSRSNLGTLPVIGDYGTMLLFAVLVTLAVRFRRKPETHKRLMLVATISIVAPALARWPGGEAGLPFSVIGPQLAMLAALAIYDKVTRRRVHPATGWGIASYVLVAGGSVGLAMSALGHNLVQSLK